MVHGVFQAIGSVVRDGFDREGEHPLAGLVIVHDVRAVATVGVVGDHRVARCVSELSTRGSGFCTGALSADCFRTDRDLSHPGDRPIR